LVIRESASRSRHPGESRDPGP